MEGYLKISTTNEGIQSECKLSHVSGLDRVLLLNSFANLLHMDDRDLQNALLILPLARGLMDNNGVPEEVSADE